MKPTTTTAAGAKWRDRRKRQCYCKRNKGLLFRYLQKCFFVIHWVSDRSFKELYSAASVAFVVGSERERRSHWFRCCASPASSRYPQKKPLKKEQSNLLAYALGRLLFSPVSVCVLGWLVGLFVSMSSQKLRGLDEWGVWIQKRWCGSK